MPKSSDHDPALDEQTMLFTGSLAELQAALAEAREERGDARDAPEPPSLMARGQALPSDPFDEPTTILDRSTLDAMLAQPLPGGRPDPALEEVTDVEQQLVGLDEETVLVDREALAGLLLSLDDGSLDDGSLDDGAEMLELGDGEDELFEVGDDEEELIEIATSDVQIIEEPSGELIALSDALEEDSAEILALGDASWDGLDEADEADEAQEGHAPLDLGFRTLQHDNFDVVDIQERVRRVVPAEQPHPGEAMVEVFDAGFDGASDMASDMASDGVFDALVPHEDDLDALDDVASAPAGFVLLADGEQLAEEEQTRVMEALNPRVFGGVSAFPFAMAPGLLEEAFPSHTALSADPSGELEVQPLLCHDDVETFPFGATRAERRAWRRSVAG